MRKYLVELIAEGCELALTRRAVKSKAEVEEIMKRIKIRVDDHLWSEGVQRTAENGYAVRDLRDVARRGVPLHKQGGTSR